MERIPAARPTVTDEMVEAAANALRNEKMVLGESVFKFEEAFARYTGTKHAISLSSGTNALHLTLEGLGVRGKQVITTTLSFVATANVIVQAGGEPTFSDASQADNNIEPTKVRQAIGPSTSALMPVHLFGHPCDMRSLGAIAEENGLTLIEDACQAHGASYHGKKAGAMGHVGCFSFYPTKNMTVGGDGGMITTDDADLAKRIAKLRDCGRVSRYVHDVIGYTSRLNSSNAAFGLVQLKHLDQWNDRRRAIARLYTGLLKDVVELTPPPMGDKDVVPVFHLYAVHCQRRDVLAQHLVDKGIECGVHYPVPIHLQPVYKDLYGFKGGEFPVAERLSQMLLSLPIFPTMTDDQVRRVAEEIRQFYGR